MKEAFFPRRDALRRGGFTLIEVLIALVIFLFGAVAIVRIFPPALGVIQNSGDQLTALNLNRTTLARYAKESNSSGPSALPDAIYDNNNNPSLLLQPTEFAGATVGSALRNNSIPRSNVQDIAGSTLDHFKVIVGEKHKVRSATVNVGGVLTQIKYILTSFPIAGPVSTTTPGTRPPLARVYKEETLTGVVVRTKAATAPVGNNRSGYLDFSNASSDPPSTTFALPPTGLPIPSDNPIYYVSYKYLEGGVLNATNDEAVYSYTGNSPSATPLKIDATTPNLSAQDSSIQVLQGRRLPNNASNGVVDGPVQARYRQYLRGAYVTGAIFVEPVDTGTNTVNINRQEVRNNLGILIVPTLTVGQEVSVDYQVNSWDQLVSNSLPSVAPEATPTPGPNPPPPNNGTARDVVLPLRFLADGKEGSPTSIYSLLSYLDTDPNSTLSLQANALDTNDVLSNPTQFALWGANRKVGRVTFDINDHANPGTPQDYTVLQSRIVYKTLENWTHQLSVAPKNYTPYFGTFINTAAGQNQDTTAPEPWRYYFWDKTDPQNRIYFPPSEAGKTIALSYASATGPVDNAVVTINERWIRDTEAPTTARYLAATDSSGDKWLAYAEPKLDAISGASIPLTAISAVRGVSVQARTAWLDGAKFNQVSTVGFRGESN